MSFYNCPCLNVSISYNGQQDKKDDLLDQFDANNSKSDLKDLFITSKIYTTSSTDKLQEWLDSFLKIKYPQLIGTQEQITQSPTQTQTHAKQVTYNKCLVCNVYTHCLIINGDSSESASTSATENFCILNELELINEPPLSLSELIQKYNQFSAIYNIILPDQLQESPILSNLDELKVKLKTNSQQEQTSFLKQIQLLFDEFMSMNKNNLSKSLLDKEINLKKTFEYLINVLLDNGTSLDLKTPQESAITTQLQVQKKERPTTTKKFKKSKSAKKLDANNNNNKSVMMNDIFDLEFEDSSGLKSGDYQDNESIGDESQDEDDDDDDEDNEEEDNASGIAENVLKKRNSNVENIDRQFGSSNASMIKNNNKMLNNATYGKYSCSLPREIPAMVHHNQHHPNTHKVIHNENDFDDADDDLFQEESDEEQETNNMAKNISDLASSIVEKDGRELFGGVPSRRVPIHSISQSFF